MRMQVVFSESNMKIHALPENDQMLNANMGKIIVLHDGENGATFTPSVSDDGVISWTNDRELENPPPVNIKGDKGDKGDQGERGLQGIQGIQGERGADGAKGEKGDRGEQGVQGIQGIQGVKGDPGKDGTNGKDGADGYTPIKGTDYFTEADKQELAEEAAKLVETTEGLWEKIDGENGIRLRGTGGVATGNCAISAGDDKTASNGTAYKSVASGDHAVVFGYGNTCSGRTTLAQGLYNTVDKNDSAAFGQKNIVSGAQSFAAGMQNEITAMYSNTFGYNNKVTATNGFAAGYKNTASGSGAIAIGNTCESSGESSLAMGYHTKASGDAAVTLGVYTNATGKGEVAMGEYNHSYTSDDPAVQTLFSFGNGTSDTQRSNAFEIKKNGDVYFGGTKFDRDSFATKAYIEELIGVIENGSY